VHTSCNRVRPRTLQKSASSCRASSARSASARRGVRGGSSLRIAVLRRRACDSAYSGSPVYSSGSGRAGAKGGCAAASRLRASRDSRRRPPRPCGDARDGDLRVRRATAAAVRVSTRAAGVLAERGGGVASEADVRAVGSWDVDWPLIGGGARRKRACALDPAPGDPSRGRPPPGSAGVGTTRCVLFLTPRAVLASSCAGAGIARLRAGSSPARARPDLTEPTTPLCACTPSCRSAPKLRVAHARSCGRSASRFCVLKPAHEISDTALCCRPIMLDVRPSNPGFRRNLSRPSGSEDGASDEALFTRASSRSSCVSSGHEAACHWANMLRRASACERASGWSERSSQSLLARSRSRHLQFQAQKKGRLRFPFIASCSVFGGLVCFLVCILVPCQPHEGV